MPVEVGREVRGVVGRAVEEREAAAAQHRQSAAAATPNTAPPPRGLKTARTLSHVTYVSDRSLERFDALTASPYCHDSFLLEPAGCRDAVREFLDS